MGPLGGITDNTSTSSSTKEFFTVQFLGSYKQNVF